MTFITISIEHSCLTFNDESKRVIIETYYLDSLPVRTTRAKRQGAQGSIFSELLRAHRHSSIFRESVGVNENLGLGFQIIHHIRDTGVKNDSFMIPEPKQVRRTKNWTVVAKLYHLYFMCNTNTFGFEVQNCVHKSSEGHACEGSRTLDNSTF